MLKLTKKAEYGLIALKHLGVNHRSASAKEISDAYCIPLPLLSKVLQTLARTGFLTAEHGTNGGYRLRRDPHRITVLEVIHGIDGPVFLTSCLTAHGECGVLDRCNIKEPLRKLHESIHSVLQNMTIADMCEEGELAGRTYSEPLTLLTVA